MSLQLTSCPSCGAPAEVVDEGCVDSTSGPVALLRVRCARRHWFLLDAPALERARARGVRSGSPTR